MTSISTPEKFSDTRITMQTVMLYTNVYFDQNEIFKNIHIPEYQHRDAIRYTPRVHNIFKKSFVMPDSGTIFYASKGDRFRGFRIKKQKKFWCAKKCQKMSIPKNVGDGIEFPPKEIKTCTQIVEEVHDDPVYGDHSIIKYQCSECGDIYTHTELKRLPNFLNQVSLNISLGDHAVNAMISEHSIKISGIRKISEVSKLIKIIFTNIVGDFSVLDGPYPTIISDIVLINRTYSINHNVNKSSLFQYIIEEGLENEHTRVMYDPTESENLRIKMSTPRPRSFVRYQITSMENGKCVIKRRITKRPDPFDYLFGRIAVSIVAKTAREHGLDFQGEPIKKKYVQDIYRYVRFGEEYTYDISRHMYSILRKDIDTKKSLRFFTKQLSNETCTATLFQSKYGKSCDTVMLSGQTHDICRETFDFLNDVLSKYSRG